MILILETIIFIIFFTLMVLYMSKDPIKTLYNYPPKIQEKVKSLKTYKDKIPTTKNMLATKILVGLAIIILVSLVFRYINGYQTFQEVFIGGMIIWTIINLYDVLVIDLLWFCQSDRFVFKGTESIRKEYKNYWFHIKQGIIGEFIGAGVVALAGLIVQFVL